MFSHDKLSYGSVCLYSVKKVSGGGSSNLPAPWGKGKTAAYALSWPSLRPAPWEVGQRTQVPSPPPFEPSIILEALLHKVKGTESGADCLVYTSGSALQAVRS